MYEEVTAKCEIVIGYITELLLQGFGLSASMSGGKDSTAVVILMLEAIKRLKEKGAAVRRCYILNSNTLIDMPALDDYLIDVFSNIEMFVAKHGLDVCIERVIPPCSGRFTWITLGRGKLPSFPGGSRDCAIDMKIKPMQSRITQIEKEAGGRIISLVGSRSEESVARNASLERFGLTGANVVEVDNHLTFAPISDWEVDDVWACIWGVCSDKGQAPKLFHSFLANFEPLVRIYRDANEGTCGIVFGDRGNRSPCSSRFGCAFCSLSTRDRSLESLIKENEDLYGFMKPFLRFRAHLFNIRWDMNRRDWRGRSVSCNHLKVVPDYFSSETKRELFRFLCTIDANEIDRARAHQEKWDLGQLEQTSENERLCSPMFQLISYTDVLLIDLQWAINRDFPWEPSPAASDYIRIHELRQRYDIPSLTTHERAQIPKARWLPINDTHLGAQAPVGINELFTPELLQKLNYSDKLEVTDGAGWEYVGLVRSHFYHLNMCRPNDFIRAALTNDWVRVSKGQLERWHAIALRNDYVHKRIMCCNSIIADDDGEECLMSMTDFLIDNSISDAELQNIRRQKQRESILSDEQMDLLGYESLFHAMEKAEQLNKAPLKKPKRVNKTHISEYADANGQLDVFGL